MNTPCHAYDPCAPRFRTFLEEQKESILSRWNEDPAIRTLFERFAISKEEHRANIAAPVLENLILMLSTDEMLADCPIMRQLVETFYNRGLSVEDVFLNCTGLKNAVIALLFEAPEHGEWNIAGVMQILDKNLYHILSFYTVKLKEQEQDLKIHNRIIEEHVLLSVTDLDGKITHVTDAFCALTGFAREELLGCTHTLIRHPEIKDAFFKGMWKRILAGKSWKGKIRNRKKDGGEFIANTEIIPVLDDSGPIREFIAIRHDITDKELSALDPLTGLYNRRKFDLLFKHSLAKKAVASLVVVDLDHFKTINDTYGHAVGDSVLKQFASIITTHTRLKDISARWGGEEFVILLPDTPCIVAYAIAERIRKATEKAALIEGHTVRCSIGLSQQRADDTPQSFFERADRLLYKAKNSGRNRTVTDGECLAE
jgi:diguanylate cyclase (GGDEF)-like protein/PAS domain S-box-containing protein